MDDTVYVDKDRLFSEYHRLLRAWKNTINESIKCHADVQELVKDDERYHGKVLGFLDALKCMPLSVVTDGELENLRKELCDVRVHCDEQINIYYEIR